MLPACRARQIDKPPTRRDAEKKKERGGGLVDKPPTRRDAAYQQREQPPQH